MFFTFRRFVGTLHFLTTQKKKERKGKDLCAYVVLQHLPTTFYSKRQNRQTRQDANPFISASLHDKRNRHDISVSSSSSSLSLCCHCFVVSFLWTLLFFVMTLDVLWVLQQQLPFLYFIIIWFHALSPHSFSAFVSPSSLTR